MTLAHVEEVAIPRDTFKLLKGTAAPESLGWRLESGALIRGELGREVVAGFRLLSIVFDVVVPIGALLDVDVIRLEAGESWDSIARRSYGHGSQLDRVNLAVELSSQERIVVKASLSGAMGRSRLSAYLRRIKLP